METIVSNKIIENYAKYISNWNFNAKQMLIDKIITKKECKYQPHNDFSSCFGAWVDSKTADEIIDELK